MEKTVADKNGGTTNKLQSMDDSLGASDNRGEGMSAFDDILQVESSFNLIYGKISQCNPLQLLSLFQATKKLTWQYQEKDKEVLKYTANSLLEFLLDSSSCRSHGH